MRWCGEHGCYPRVTLGREDPLEEGMATNSSILGWRIPRDEQGWLGVRWGEQGVHLLLYSFSSELLDLTAAWGPAETQGRKV